VVPWPEAVIERVYSRGVYLRLQPLVTGATNLVPVAVGDLAWAGLAGWLVWTWLGPIRARPVRPAAVRATWRTVTVTAMVWLVFLGSWGLNYRRVPLLAQPGVATADATEADVEALGWLVVERMNGLHAAAHAAAWPTTDWELTSRLAPAFADAQREIGLPRPATAGRPKPTWLGWYFERAAIAGMTNPLGLEVYITPGALPFERPAILAHEWAHLAGFADESDAGLVGWVICQRGDVQARYSAWLDLYPRVWSAVGSETRRALVSAVDAGPRHDLEAIAARLARVSPTVRRVAWEGYDRFLRSQGVAGGIDSYDRVVVALLRSRWNPVGREGTTSGPAQEH
jgi:hypothetical protein